MDRATAVVCLKGSTAVVCLKGSTAVVCMKGDTAVICMKDDHCCSIFTLRWLENPEFHCL